MADEKKKVPPLKKKDRSLRDIGPDSLAAALNWDKLASKIPPDPAQPDPAQPDPAQPDPEQKP